MNATEIDSAAMKVLASLYRAGHSQADVWAILRRAGFLDCGMSEVERDAFLARAVIAMSIASERGAT